MNKVIKSMVAIVLAVTMMFSGAVSAFAAGSEGGLFETLTQVKEYLAEKDVKAKVNVVKGEVKDLLGKVKTELNKLDDAEIDKLDDAMSVVLSVARSADESLKASAEAVEKAYKEMKSVIADAKALVAEVEEVANEFTALADELLEAMEAYEDLANAVEAVVAVDPENVEDMKLAVENLKTAQAKVDDLRPIDDIMDDVTNLEASFEVIDDVVDCMDKALSTWNELKAAMTDLLNKMKASKNYAVQAVANNFEGKIIEKINKIDDVVKATAKAVKEYADEKLPAAIAKAKEVIEPVKDKILAVVDKADSKSEAVAKEMEDILVKLSDNGVLAQGTKDTMHHLLSWVDAHYPSVLDAMEVYTPETVEWLIDATTTEGNPVWPRVKAEEPDVLLGDVNLDGKVDYADEVKLYNYAVTGRLTSLEAQALLNADVNKDGKVDYADEVKLYNHVVTGRIAAL